MKNLNKKSVILITSLALSVLVIAGGTLAILKANAGPVTNTFETTEITSEVEENFDGETKKNVKIQNTSKDVSAYIRAAVIINWKDENDHMQPAAPTDYVWTGGFNGTNSKWEKIGNYYYFMEPVKAGKLTDNLIGEIKVAEGVTPPEGYYLDVVILGSAIQSEPADAIEEAWKIDPDRWTAITPAVED